MNWQLLEQLDIVRSFVAIVVTLGAYLLALKLFKTVKFSVIFHPILIGALLVVLAAVVSKVSLLEYQIYVAPLNWLLGPVTVALAVPLYQQVSGIYREGAKGGWVILFGGLVAPLSALMWFVYFDFSDPIINSVLTKSITTPLAMDTAALITGIPALAAAIVVMTGIVAVVFSPLIFKLTSCNDPQAQGVALGTTAHAIGTAQAHQLGVKAAAFSTMALCINGVLTAIILPTIMWIFS